MWDTVKYAAVGRGHERSGAPCQDKVECLTKDGVVVMALSDGAGSAKLSHYGAESAVSAACRLLAARFDEWFAGEDASVVRRSLVEGVLSDLRKTAQRLDCKESDLACTLLAVAVKEGRFLAAHIGDGVIGYETGGRILLASGPDNGEYANETFFVTSPAALSRMRLIRGETDGIGGFVLMSDGTGSSLYDRRGQVLSQGILRMMRMTGACSREAAERMLRDAFDRIILTRTADDCSLSLLVDRDVFPRIGRMPLAQQMEILQTGPSMKRGRSRTRRTVRILESAAEGMRVRELAKRVHINARYLKRKLDGLASMGLVTFERGICRAGCVEDTAYTKQGSGKRKEDRR